MKRIILEEQECNDIKYLNARIAANNLAMQTAINGLRDDNAALLATQRDKYFRLKNKYEIHEQIDVYRIDFYTRSLTIQNAEIDNG